MKEYRIRVKRTTIKWHIENYKKQGWEVQDIISTPYGKIKMAVFLKGNEKLILEPKPLRRYLSEESRQALKEGNINCHTFREGEGPQRKGQRQESDMESECQEQKEKSCGEQ